MCVCVVFDIYEFQNLFVMSGALPAGMLLVMVGEEVNEMRLTGWLATTNIPWLDG